MSFSWLKKLRPLAYGLLYVCLSYLVWIAFRGLDASSGTKRPPITFTQQLDKVSAFLTPQNLAQQKIQYQGKIALIVIDVQKEFCDRGLGRGNDSTEVISARIQSLAPAFRQAGIPVYAVYSSRNEDIRPEEIDFHHFRPEAGDVLIRKDRNSAFAGSAIEDSLHNKGRTLLLVCGFNASACVRQTVNDALDEGFDVCVLDNLTGNDDTNGLSAVDESLQGLRDNGTATANAGAVLTLLRERMKGPQ